MGVTLYVCNITTQIKSNQEVNTEKLSLEYLNFQNIDECNKVNVTLIFQPSSKITTIGGYDHEYIFHYQFQHERSEIRLENTRLISISTSKLFSFGIAIQCIS